MQHITMEMVDELKNFFVTKEECQKRMEEENQKITDLRVDMAKIVSKLNILIAILSAIGASLIGVCIKLLFGA